MIDRLANAIKSHAAGLDQSLGQVKFGVVTSVNSQNATARVLIQPDDVLSGWLPVLSQWVGSGWGMICPLTPGDQVVLVPQQGDAEQGVIIGRSFSTKQLPPVVPGGEFWLIHQSGSFLKLCNDGTVRISGDLHVQGNVYDEHGSIAALRATYNSHVHSMASNNKTAPPSVLD